jgi:hypothetical protein
VISDGDVIGLLSARLAGRYTLERELGRGGMATVYLARDLPHGRLVALKILHRELGSLLAADRFAREIAIAARLNHSHILPLLDSGAVELPNLGPLLYYAMPYVEGRTLRERLREEPQLPIAEAVSLAAHIGRALQYAHDRGVVHRDIKPENILLNAGHPLVADFGIARALDASGGDKLTETGLAVGTPTYMSPEQASGRERLDGRSDQYALACVVYEMLAGQPPFGGPTPQAVLARHAVDPVPPLRSVRPAVPLELEQVVAHGLAKVPADRYPSSGEFAAALETALTARPESVTLRVAPPRRPIRRRVMGGAAAAVAVGLAGTAALLLPRGKPPTWVPTRAVVAPLDNPARDSAIADLGRQVAATLPEAIAREGVGEPVAAATVRDLLARARGSPDAVAERLARATGAGLAIHGACTPEPAGRAACRVDLLRMPARTLRMSATVVGNPSESAFAGELSERALVMLLLQQVLGDRVVWQGEYIPRSIPAVRSYFEGRDVDLKHIRQASRLDTAWVDAAAWAAMQLRVPEAESMLTRLASRPDLRRGERENVLFQLANIQGDPEIALEMARRRFAVNPEEWANPAGRWAVFTNRPNTALAITAYADSALPRDGLPYPAMHAWTYLQRLAAMHQLHRYGEELRLARELARRYPAWVPFGRRDARAPFHANELMALAGLGWDDSIRALLAQWEAAPESHWRFGVGSRAWIAGLELMAHGHEAQGREVLETALAEYRNQREGDRPRIEETWIASWLGRLDEARRLATNGRSGARTAEDSLAWLGALGSITALDGRRAEATRYDSMLAVAGSRAFVAGAAAFRRAEIASSFGDRAGAVRLLEAARAKTRGDAAYVNVHRWPYFANLRGYPPFEQFLRPRD